MAISVDHATKVITVPQSDLTALGGGVYQLDVEWLRLQLKDFEDSVEGMAMPDTHRRNAQVTLAGTTFAQTFEIINGYTITFTPNSEWRVRCTNANHNIADVMNVNQVSIEIGNSAGLISAGAGASAAEVWQHLLEGSLTAEQMLRIILAALAGTTTGAGTSNEKFKSRDGTIDRIDATYDGSNNRTAVTVNGG